MIICDKEICVRMIIGSIHGNRLFYIDSNNRFEIELDAGRYVQLRFDDCKHDIFAEEKVDVAKL